VSSFNVQGFIDEFVEKCYLTYKGSSNIIVASKPLRIQYRQKGRRKILGEKAGKLWQVASNGLAPLESPKM